MQTLLPTEYTAFFEALESPAAVSVRWNPAKSDPPISVRPVPWCGAGQYLPQRPVFTLDPRFHAGIYYVQDASCMLLEAALHQLNLLEQPLLALDLCAAPGGKSTHLLSVLHPDTILIANEVIAARTQILRENLIKWGADRTVITRNTAADFQALPFDFDLVLVDAPCSGEGLFRKQADASQTWSPAQVEGCARRQSEILTQIWPRLKAGGYLIYSTCTWNRQENEDLLQALRAELDFTLIELNFPEAWQIHTSDTLPLYRCLPHRVSGEGFSLAVLQKQASACSPPKPHKTRAHTRNTLPTEILNWVADTAEADLYLAGAEIWRWPAEQLAVLQAAQTALNVNYAGVCLGTLKGRDLCPDSALALYPRLQRHCFPVYDLALEQALAYLNRESLSGQGKGWGLVTYQNNALGWVKATPTHLNNNWPKNWKIRQSFQKTDWLENQAKLP